MTTTFLRSFGRLPDIDSMDANTLRKQARFAELVRLAGFFAAAGALCLFLFAVTRQHNTLGIMLGLACMIVYSCGLGLSTVATVLSLALRRDRPDRRPIERWFAEAYIFAFGVLCVIISVLGLWLALANIFAFADAPGNASIDSAQVLANRILVGMTMMGALPFGTLFCVMGALMLFPSMRSSLQAIPNRQSESSPGE